MTSSGGQKLLIPLTQQYVPKASSSALPFWASNNIVAPSSTSTAPMMVTPSSTVDQSGTTSSFTFDRASDATCNFASSLSFPRSPI